MLLAASRAVPLAAEPLPLSRALGDGPSVEIELVAAEIRVTLDASAEPRLVAKSLEADGAGELDVTSGPGGLRVSRKSQRAAFPRIRVEITMAPERALAVSGGDLTVQIEHRGGATAPPAVALNGGPGIQLVLVRSQVSATGVPFLGAVLTDSWLNGLANGALELTATASTVELRGLEREARVEGHGARIVLQELAGTLEARLEGGELDLNGGSGLTVVEATDAQVRATQRTGALRFSGERCAVELLGAGGGAEISGSELLVRLESSTGKVSAQLAGGTLGVNELTGDLRLTLSGGTDAQVNRLSGELAIDARGGSRLSLTGARALRGTFAEGTLWAEGVTRVDLGGERSTVTLRGVASVARLALTDCESELDLRSLGANATISLLGATRAKAWLDAPCIVSSRPVGGGVGAGDVQVTGCDLNAPGQGLQTMALRRNYGGQARLLTVELAETARLEVASAP